ncbi:MAG TPA: methyl-accepting chemotaxis protein [Ktedonobacteraceae bacterium]
MLKLISNYPISRRLIIAFALAAILPSVVIAIMGTYYGNQLSTRRNASSVITSVQESTDSWSDSLHSMYIQTKTVETQVTSVLLSPDATTHATLSTTLKTTAPQIMQDATQQMQDLNTYRSLFDPSLGQSMQPVTNILSMVAPNDSTSFAETSLLHDITTTSWPNYELAQKAELNLLTQIMTNPAQYKSASSTVAKISADASRLNSTYKNINRDWAQIGKDVIVISKHVNGVDTNEAQPVVIGTIGAFLITLLVVILAGVLVHRSISGPLNELVLLTRRISKGDRFARAHINSNDEISIVATSMNSMLDNIVHLVQETQSQRDVLQGQVEKLVSEVSGVGDGDLRVNAEVTADALGVLADSFNYMVEELGSLVVRVKKVAREVEESTNITTDRMGELVETADRQIEEIENAAIEIERMAVNSQQVAQRARALASIARDARITAQGGRLAVQQTIEGMGRIYSNVQQTSHKVQSLGERSREIDNIVEAISNIAHQTNRLALDAAIQAAMAGDNGKGFGAVAADIRRLAERAKELATSVGRIVRNVRDEIGAVAISMNDTERETSAGSKLAEEAGTSLESIVAVIERQADEIEGIKQMAVQQQQSSSEVVQMMQHVSETTQQSTTSTRAAAQNMEHVAQLAEQLLASVEAFKLRDSLNYLEAGSDVFGEGFDGPITPGKLFRAVTATANTMRNSNAQHTPPPPDMEGFFPQFPQFSPSLQSAGNSMSPSTQPPQWQGEGPASFLPNPANPGQQAFPAWNNTDQQQVLPAWTNGNPQQVFPAQNNWPPGAQMRPAGTQPRPPRTPSRPLANDWQIGNHHPSDR